MDCIKCKAHIADKTPWLCEECFGHITYDLARYFHKFDERFEGALKEFGDKVVNMNKEAFDKHKQ